MTIDTDARALPSLEELLAHAGWLRRLARGLCGPGGDPDDAVQRSLLAAVRRRPDTTRSPAPWLAQVLRNVVRTERRDVARTRARETAAHLVAETTAPSPEALVERLELSRLVAGCVSELGEPGRRIVLLRFYEELSSVEIGRALGMPAGTVRWRLKEALEELRGRLDACSDGERQRWAVGLEALAASPQAASSLASRSSNSADKPTTSAHGSTTARHTCRVGPFARPAAVRRATPWPGLRSRPTNRPSGARAAS